MALMLRKTARRVLDYSCRIPAIDYLVKRNIRLTGSGWDRFYAQSHDPYLFDSNPYEDEKFKHIMSALGPGQYKRAWEIGCAIGSLTERLAEVCDSLVATDISQLAVDRTRARLAGRPRVEVQRGVIPQDRPDGSFDLIVCSDVLYYLSPAELDKTIQLMSDKIRGKGTILSLHYLGDSRGIISGDDVHSRIERNLLEFSCTYSETIKNIGPGGAGYKIDRYDRI